LAVSTLVLAGMCGCSSGPQTLTVEEQIERVKAGVATGVVCSEPPGADVIRQLAALPQLKKIEIEKGPLSVDDLQLLATVKTLDHLIIRSNIDDLHMQAVVQCKQLRVLNIPDGSYTDQAFASLATLPHLELLRTGSPRLTDNALLPVASFPALRFLHLTAAPLTDAGLQPLHEAPQLESFYIDDSRVTAEGIDALLAARPDLHVHINQQHPDRADGHTHSH